VSAVLEKMKNTIVKLEDQEVTISQLPLGKFADVMRSVKQLPVHFNSLGGVSNEEAISRFPGIVADCLPEVIDVLAVTTNLTKEEVAQLSFYDVVSLTIAVYEVNKFKEIYEKIKKTFAQPSKAETKK
jgi:hypothetical protein